MEHLSFGSLILIPSYATGDRQAGQGCWIYANPNVSTILVAAMVHMSLCKSCAEISLNLAKTQ